MQNRFAYETGDRMKDTLEPLDLRFTSGSHSAVARFTPSLGMGLAINQSIVGD
jgi:hypothetical protein